MIRYETILQICLEHFDQSQRRCFVFKTLKHHWRRFCWEVEHQQTQIVVRCFSVRVQSLQLSAPILSYSFYFFTVSSKIVACVTARKMRIKQTSIKIYFGAFLDLYLWLGANLRISFRGEDVHLENINFGHNGVANRLFPRLLLCL